MDASLISTRRGGGAAADPIIALSDVHLSLSSRAGTVDILRGIDLEIARGCRSASWGRRARARRRC
jgi:predicted ABC-type transport system involved in lysophospholipase L1 biosynthesis ATPase subunit